MKSTVFAQRVAKLRSAMAEAGLAAYVVLTSDPHLSEYLPEHWQARQWLSGFTGSAGTLVVCANFAGLWADSRYWEQAEAELQGSGIQAMRLGDPDTDDYPQWLAQHLDSGDKVGVDGNTLSLRLQKHWQSIFDKKGLLLQTEHNLVANIWPDQPPLPKAPIYRHDIAFACRDRADKLAAVRQQMHDSQCRWHLVSSLDDIAWLLNLRGADVDYNPVFLAHLLIGPDEAVLFVDQTKLDAATHESLLADKVAVADYTAINRALTKLPAQGSLLIDPARTTVGVLQAASHLTITEGLNPSQRLKSRKSPHELQHIRSAMRHDGAALCEFFAWLEAALERNETITEWQIDEEITLARSRQPHFISPSFSTIAAFNANAAMPHYQASKSNHAQISGDGLLLIDSGGQYLNGTTDITRMVAIGRLSEAQKNDCTAVLKGMIALSQAVFPRNLPASRLDPIARSALWATEADYGHGTGHGVGYFLNVHEGPQAISWRAPDNPDAVMDEGMVTSNEPGLYRPGQWGVRIENLVACRLRATNAFGEFLEFETLTLCPIDTRCFTLSRLTASERRWLNDYHQHVREQLLPLVKGSARDWLLARTSPLAS